MEMVAASGGAQSLTIQTVENLKCDPDVEYRLRVLLFDLCNLSKRHDSHERLEQTTDSLYISGPYLTPEQAVSVREATSCGGTNPDGTERRPGLSVQDALTKSMEDLFEKRRASGDARPCGPHDLAPLYLSIFGITSAELADEQFLRRLGRQGLSVANAGLDSVGRRAEKGKGRKEAQSADGESGE
ncbi:putative C6 transcription factor [Xylariomycetidae sp. FL2044]|nr:putative C6 transcription factor [Xylariomycetidae sp. FL2044]